MELVAESQVELANLSFDEGRPFEAESLLRPAIGEFERENASPDAADAYTLLSRSLLMEDKIDEARNALNRAAEFSRKTPDAALKLQIEIQRARISSAASLRDSASSTISRQIVRAVIATAKKLGYYNLECEARMALNEAEMKSDRLLGRSHLAQLASEARSHGLELLARKAEQVAGGQNVLATNKPVH
jgi:tetratricopeptide (TPR) repeat protein